MSSSLTEYRDHGRMIGRLRPFPLLPVDLGAGATSGQGLRGWEEILVPDNTCTPAELAASRIDFPAWLRTLKPRDRKIARFLSVGNGTGATARKFDVSPGRISQLRKELAESWKEFTGETKDGHAAA